MIKFIKISFLGLLTGILLLFSNKITFKKYQEIGEVSPIDFQTSNGKYKDYYDDGNLHSVEYYVNGEKTGVWRYYYKNGLLKSRLSYKNNKLEGDLWHFSEEGDLVFKEKYANDTLVQRDVINDSLYKYEIVFESHGMRMFNQSCTPCHNNAQDKSLKFGVDDLHLFVDSLGIAQISLDSIHQINTDSLDIGIAIGKDKQGPIVNPELQKYDLEAIIHYLQKSGLNRKKRVGKIKIRKKTV